MAFNTKAEKRAFRFGFLKGQKNKKRVTKDPLDKIPLNYQNNVLMGDEKYQEIRREMASLFGRDKNDLVRKLSITAYKDLYGDRFLRDHYGIKKGR